MDRDGDLGPADKGDGPGFVKEVRSYVKVAVGAISQCFEGIEGKVSSSDRLGNLRCARLYPTTVGCEDNARRPAILFADAIIDPKLLAGSEICKGAVSVSHLPLIWQDSDGSNWL